MATSVRASANLKDLGALRVSCHSPVPLGARHGAGCDATIRCHDCHEREGNTFRYHSNVDFNICGITHHMTIVLIYEFRSVKHLGSHLGSHLGLRTRRQVRCEVRRLDFRLAQATTSSDSRLPHFTLCTSTHLSARVETFKSSPQNFSPHKDSARTWLRVNSGGPETSAVSPRHRARGKSRGRGVDSSRSNARGSSNVPIARPGVST